jgi:glycosyltransferase involved in cell wall biosynthesis
MKLLVIKATCPFPLNTGGSVVAYNNIRSLSQVADIHLICFGDPKETGDIGSFVGRLTVLQKKRLGRLRQLGRYALHALRGVPPTVAVHSSSEMRANVRHAIEAENFDAILVYEMSGIQFCPASALHRVIANVEDPQSLKLRRSAALSTWTRSQRVKMAISAFLTARYERRVFPKLGQVLLLSERDAAAMRARLADAKISSIPYGVDKREAAEMLDYRSRVADSIVFSGNMFHPANVDAILHFLSAVFPKVLASHPSAQLWIVGADPHEKIVEASSRFGQSVVITGKVADVQQYIRRSVVSVCPVRLDIGVQTKVLEALSWGTPVVCTSAGNSGVQAISGQHLWVEDEPVRFAERVCSLLKGERWDELSRAGRQFSQTQFSWARSAAELQRHVARLAGSEPRPPFAASAPARRPSHHGRPSR